jgi:DNA-binding response OmpR family regulator
MTRESTDVLITDDDAGIRQLVCVALRRHELSCDTAVDGRQALECLRAKDYAVLLLDLMMPQLDGFGVLDVMGSWELPPDSGPIVLVMSAFDGRDLPVIGESAHALIRKPFDLPDLAELVSGCVRIRRNAETLRSNP